MNAQLVDQIIFNEYEKRMKAITLSSSLSEALNQVLIVILNMESHFDKTSYVGSTKMKGTLHTIAKEAFKAKVEETMMKIILCDQNV